MKYIWGGIRRYFRGTDRWLMSMWLIASGASLLFLWGLLNSNLSEGNKIITQAAAIAIGLTAALIISQFDYNALLQLWKLYVPLCILLVILTYFWGTVRGGDQAWLVLKIAGRSFSMQPSELLKISFITTMALHLSKIEGELNSFSNIIMLCVHGIAHVLLIQLQGDSGTAIIFVMIFLTLLFCAGISWKYIAAAIASLAVFLPILWTQIMTDDQKMRLLTVYNPSISEKYAYQQARSVMALGLGGIQGTGIFEGRHVRVPEVYNDFIFAFIGESSGFMGCLGVIVLLTVIAFKILYNSGLAQDAVGRYICIGVFAMIAGQTIINLGMCLSLLPVIGVTLPLLSSGGTSVLSMYLGLGLVLSVYARSRKGLFHGSS